MKQEIKRTVEYITPSMPAPKHQIPFLRVLRIASSEISVLKVILLFAVSLIPTVYLASDVLHPELAVIGISPLPLILVVKKYLLSTSNAERELELTTRYSYPQVISAKTVLISAYSAVYLLALSFFVTAGAGGDFIRCVLSGTSASLFMNSAVFLLSALFRSHHLWITEASICLWLTMVIPVAYAESEISLSSLPTAMYALGTVLSLLLWISCATLKIRKENKFRA